jgi:hypothetical protein
MLVKAALQAHAEQQIGRFLKVHKSAHKKFVGASEIGMCLRRIGFAKQMTAPIENWGASRRGVTFEEHFWVPAMRKHYGKNLLFTGKQQKSLIWGNLRATPDGLLVNQPRDVLKSLGVDDIGPSRCIVLDCKSIDPRINLATVKPEHEFQVQVQMALMRITTKYRPDYALVSYTNASFFDDVVEFAVRYDPGVFAQAKQRAATVLKTKTLSELAPEGWITGGAECKYCPFEAPCREMRGEVPLRESTGNLAPGFLEKIIALAREERHWNTIICGAEEEQRKMQHEIKELLRAHDLHRISHDGIVVVWSPVKGRPALDMPALKIAAAKLGLDIQQFETVGQPTDRLTVTIKQQETPARKSRSVSQNQIDQPPT